MSNCEQRLDEGCLLSPTLFKIFIIQLLDKLRVHLGSELWYQDQGLWDLINLVKILGEFWGMEAHVTKCGRMCSKLAHFGKGYQW